MLIPPSSAVFFDWSCQVLVGREQSKSWLMLCQGRTRSVDLLCTRSSRGGLLIVFHSWKLCAQFGAKLHSTLQMHVGQRVALASMKMKRSIFSKFAAMYHRHCHVQVVAKCRAQALSLRLASAAFALWVSVVKNRRLRSYKSCKAKGVRRIAIMWAAFGDWVAGMQREQESRQEERRSSHVHVKVTTPTTNISNPKPAAFSVFARITWSCNVHPGCSHVIKKFAVRIRNELAFCFFTVVTES